MPTGTLTPSVLTASDHDLAYGYFNARLFDNQLPQCLITVSSKKRCVGYFRRSYFSQEEQHQGTPPRLHEIGMNPEYYRELREYLSTLVHEMTHLEQEVYGKPGRNGYHNRAWAARMLAVGLCPFNMRHPDRMTGVRISHTIQAGGPFDVTCTALLDGGFRVRWVHLPEQDLAPDLPPDPDERDRQVRKAQQRASKTPYVCPNCSAKLWGKAGLRVICADCIRTFEEEAP